MQLRQLTLELTIKTIKSVPFFGKTVNFLGQRKQCWVITYRTCLPYISPLLSRYEQNLYLRTPMDQARSEINWHHNSLVPCRPRRFRMWRHLSSLSGKFAEDACTVVVMSSLVNMSSDVMWYAAIALGCKPPLVTRIARIGLGARLASQVTFLASAAFIMDPLCIFVITTQDFFSVLLIFF